VTIRTSLSVSRGKLRREHANAQLGCVALVKSEIAVLTRSLGWSLSCVAAPIGVHCLLNCWRWD
jgi:hypothetical protein